MVLHVPLLFSGDETLDIGADLGTPVSGVPSHGDSEFTGEAHWVQLDVEITDADRYRRPTERLPRDHGEAVAATRTRGPRFGGRLSGPER